MEQPRSCIRNEKGYWVGTGGSKNGYRLLNKLRQKEATTIPRLLAHSAEEYGSSVCMATRQILSRSSDMKVTLGDYTCMTYDEVQNMVTFFSSGISALGTGSSGRVILFSETRAEWMIAAIGCMRHNLTVVTVHEHMTDDDFLWSVKETEVNVLITSYASLERKKKLIRKCAQITKIIVFEDQLEGIGSVSSLGKKNVISFSQVINIGKVFLAHEDSPSPSDLAIIMYTSGSSNRPKGVELTHENFFTTLNGYAIATDINATDRYLAYLPLAHVLEMATEVSLLTLGVPIYYSSPGTYIDGSRLLAEGVSGDCRVANPTFMSAVPQSVELILKQQLRKDDWINNVLCKAMLKLEICPMKIQDRNRDALGGSLKLICIGGSKLLTSTHKNIQRFLGCDVRPGYGATETCTFISCTNANDTNYGNVGIPNHGVTITLIDWEEGGYYTKDNKGEILVSGPMLAQGYFKMPALTEQFFIMMDGLRWFKTGDIGTFDENGLLYIIDRKGDLLKLANGEFISFGNIEAVLTTHLLVEQTFVWAYPGAHFCVAVVVPNAGQLRKEAERYDTAITLQDICKSKRVTAKVLKALQAHCKKHDLSYREIPAAIYLTPYYWMPSGGLVGPGFKNRRAHLKEHFQTELMNLYDQLDK